eukprot:5564107-Alexandrium_andersonii.AAC.1
MSASLVGSEMCIRDRLLGPRSSRFERLKRCCILQRADRGLGQIATLRGLGRIADCMLSSLPCEDPRSRPV